jgi:hypothetical protein
MSNVNQPLFPAIGVIAHAHDTWGSRWQARHQVLLRLARYFHVVWMNPPHNWRESLTLLHSSEPVENIPLGFPGFSVYSPEPWLPEVYRPVWLKKFIFRAHVLRAQQQLNHRGC